MEVISEFSRLVDAIASVIPGANGGLGNGASSEEISSLEKEIGFELPDQVRKLLQTHNGQLGATPVFGVYRFLSIEGIKRVRLNHGPIFVEENRFWLPVGSSDPFDLVLDCEPDSKTNRGVFTYEAETHAGPTIAPTLAEFFALSANRVSTGHYRKLLIVLYIQYE